MNVCYFVSDLDILDVAQLDQLSQIAGRGSRVVVGLVSDDDFQRLTGAWPVHTLDDRLDLAAALKRVHQVLPHVSGWSPSVGEHDSLQTYVSSAAFLPLVEDAALVKPTRRSVSSFASKLPWLRPAAGDFPVAVAS